MHVVYPSVCGVPFYRWNTSDLDVEDELLLSGKFEMKKKGELHYFLDIEVIHTPDRLLLTQHHYELNQLLKFG